MYTNVQKGIKYAIITAVISGFSIFFNKYAVGIVSPPLLFTGVKNFGVALAITALLLFNGKLNKIKQLTAKELALLSGIALIGGTIPFYLFFTGLSQIPAINAAILQKTLIVWVALFALPILKEKMTAKQFVGLLLVVLGNFWIGGFKGFTFSTGELMVLVSAFFWAIEYVIAKKALSSVDYDLVSFFRMMFGSLILLGASFFSSSTASFKFSYTNVFWLIISMAFLYGYVLNWYRALQFAPALTVSTILVSSTLITNVLSAIFVTKSLAAPVIAQSLLILMGSIIYIKATAKAYKTETVLVDKSL